jgi:hypothetical protein
VLVLAIYNLKGNETLLARQLASVLGKTIYETSSRVRAPGGGPSVIARFIEPSAAHETAATLHAQGFDTLLLDDGDIEQETERFVVRSFRLEGTTMQLESHKAHLEVSYGEVDLMIRGVQIQRRQRDAPRPTRKLSLVRAALTGGLIMSKRVQPPRPPASEDREGFLHLYAHGKPPIAWREGDLLYRSLGTALQPSRHANFAQVVVEVRQRCAEAKYDDRLLTSAGQAQLLGPSLSTDENLNVAISVLARALRQTAV